MTDRAKSPAEVAVPQDAGLRCPQCEYNLTGLPEPRCPECGTEFDWEQVRLDAFSPPRIAFERARGWRKIPAFWLTWLTVLFAPWIFARQITRRVSARHALTFAGGCFASTAIAFVFGMDLKFFLTWLSTAAVYLMLQTVGLALLDRPGWKRPAATLRFWALAGCYTSAIVVTEIVCGPPEITLEALPNVVRLGWSSSFRWDDGEFWVFWAQMILWLTGLAMCYYYRISRGGVGRPKAALATIAVWLGVLVLYAVVVEHLGVGFFYDLYDAWL